MIVTQKIKTDLIHRDMMPQIYAVQGDANTRAIALSLYSGGEAWAVPDGVSVAMRYRKPDGTKGVYDTLPDGTKAWSAEDNTVTMLLAPQMLTAEGAVFAQLEIALNADVLATFSLQIIVAENPAAGALDSEDYVNWLQWMEDKVDEHVQEAVEGGYFTGPQGDAGPQGPEGKSAYAYAVEGGYTGTAAEFSEKMAGEYLPTDGSVPMEGELAMGGSKITGLGTPTENTDAATKAYADGMLPKSGGTMTGAIAMSSKKITGLATPTADTDAATKAYVDGKISITKLWSNSSPTSSFAGQTVSLSLSSYNMLLVIGRESTSSSRTMATIAKVGATGRLFLMANYRQFRDFSVTTTGVTFGSGYDCSLTESSTVLNTSAIPIEIYAIKGVS